MATAWIAGGTGLVGGALLQGLLRDDFFDQVAAVGRRTFGVEHPKLKQVVVDFSSLDSFELLPPADVIGLIAMRALAPVLGKYRPTPVEAVAKAMIELAKNPTTGSHVVEADAIRRIAG